MPLPAKIAVVITVIASTVRIVHQLVVARRDRRLLSAFVLRGEVPDVEPAELSPKIRDAAER